LSAKPFITRGVAIKGLAVNERAAKGFLRK
jgi:hypothetical protein